jgi:hypothetical protein
VVGRQALKKLNCDAVGDFLIKATEAQGR